MKDALMNEIENYMKCKIMVHLAFDYSSLCTALLKRKFFVIGEEKLFDNRNELS